MIQTKYHVGSFYQYFSFIVPCLALDPINPDVEYKLINKNTELELIQVEYLGFQTGFQITNAKWPEHNGEINCLAINSTSEEVLATVQFNLHFLFFPYYPSSYHPPPPLPLPPPPLPPKLSRTRRTTIVRMPHISRFERKQCYTNWKWECTRKENEICGTLKFCNVKEVYVTKLKSFVDSNGTYIER